MKLILTNGYPFPYPANLTEQENEELCATANQNTIEISGVVNFQILHTVTVEFDSFEAMRSAKDATGWDIWSGQEPILEAKWSDKDGYSFPAIIAGDLAYCGYTLIQEDE